MQRNPQKKMGCAPESAACSVVRPNPSRQIRRCLSGHPDPFTSVRDLGRSRAYVARPTAQGKTTWEIRRCLKRYIARELDRYLTRTMNPPVSP
jgi:hypothetical protein